MMTKYVIWETRILAQKLDPHTVTADVCYTEIQNIFMRLHLITAQNLGLSSTSEFDYSIFTFVLIFSDS